MKSRLRPPRSAVIATASAAKRVAIQAGQTAWQDCRVAALLAMTPDKSTLHDARRRKARRFGYSEPMEFDAQTPSLPQPQSLVGTWRRFGTTGPVYEIIGIGVAIHPGNRLMRIRLVESGEEVDYRLTEILDDPKER